MYVTEMNRHMWVEEAEILLPLLRLYERETEKLIMQSYTDIEIILAGGLTISAERQQRLLEFMSAAIRDPIYRRLFQDIALDYSSWAYAIAPRSLDQFLQHNNEYMRKKFQPMFSVGYNASPERHFEMLRRNRTFNPENSSELDNSSSPINIFKRRELDEYLEYGTVGGSLERRFRNFLTRKIVDRVRTWV